MDAFISYRRKPSAALALLVQEKLKNKYKIDAYVDTTRTDSTKVQFPERLMQAIKDAPVFVCLLGDETLESEWVLKEVEEAYRLSKRCIPIFQESYKAPTNPSPAVNYLLSFDGIHVMDLKNIHVDYSMQELAALVKPPIRPNLVLMLISAITFLSLAALGIMLTSNLIQNNRSEEMTQAALAQTPEITSENNLIPTDSPTNEPSQTPSNEASSTATQAPTHTSRPTETSTPTATNTDIASLSGQQSGRIEHRVLAGDTLAAISVAYGVPASEILRLNNLTSEQAQFLQLGQILLIQEGSETSSSGSVETENLLQNPGFESAGNYVDQRPSGSSYAFAIAPSWNGWFTLSPSTASWMNIEPIAYPHSGNYRQEGFVSQNIGRGDATWTAVIYQIVPDISDGTHLRFSVWVFQDSQEGSESQTRVGIGSNLGGNPLGSPLTWSQWMTAIDEWQQITLDVTVPSGSVTVFIYSTQSHPKPQNQNYYDGAELFIINR